MRRTFFTIIYIILFVGIGFKIANPDTVHKEIAGETIGEFIALLNFPQGFLLAFNYDVKTESHVSILDANEQEVNTIDFLSDGVSIGEHKTLELKKGEYTVKENFTVIGIPDSPFLQEQLLEGRVNFEWKFNAPENGTYDYSITAEAWDLTLSLEGDLELLHLGEMGISIPAQIVTTRDINVGENIKYNAIYTFKLSRTSDFELISEEEKPVNTFVVTGVVRHENETVVPNASVTVTNEIRSLSKTATTDKAGIYKVTFVGPQDSILAQTGDVLKITIDNVESSYTITKDDISQARSIVNVILEEPKIKPRWDINQDGKVDILDLISVAENYGKKDIKEADNALAADINDDKMIDISDLVLVGKHFGDNTDQ
jgi:hypothetical protein